MTIIKTAVILKTCWSFNMWVYVGGFYYPKGQQYLFSCVFSTINKPKEKTKKKQIHRCNLSSIFMRARSHYPNYYKLFFPLFFIQLKFLWFDHKLFQDIDDELLCTPTEHNNKMQLLLYVYYQFLRKSLFIFTLNTFIKMFTIVHAHVIIIHH